MSKTMDRRKFLLGSVGAAALGALVKPAPTPFVEGSVPLMAEVGLVNEPASILPGNITYVCTQLPKMTWRSLQTGEIVVQ